MTVLTRIIATPLPGKTALTQERVLQHVANLRRLGAHGVGVAPGVGAGARGVGVAPAAGAGRGANGGGPVNRAGPR